MALVWADRVRETSSTSGTGAITPSGAFDASFVTITSELSPGDTAYFGVRDGAGAWNTFLGTWNGTEVARTSILAGSDGLNPVNLSGADVEIWIDAPADWIGTRINAAGAPVQSVAGRTGAVVLAAADISGLAASATIDTTNANNITNGTLGSARLPIATGVSVGGVTSGANITNTGGSLSVSGANVVAALGFTPGIGTVTNIATAGLATGGPITSTGTVSVAVPAAGVVLSNGAAPLLTATLGGGLDLAGVVLRAAVQVNAQSGNYTPLAADRGKIVRFTGSAASTITLSGAGLADGWYIVLEHRGTGTTAAAKRLAYSGTIDGVVNPAEYPGAARLIQWDGAAFTSVLLAGGYIEIRLSDSPFTLTLPPPSAGGGEVCPELWGAGGGGGSGRRGAAGGVRTPGCGGGGGAYNTLSFPYAALGGASITCTVGAGGAGAAAITVDSTNGNTGTAGGNTTFGALLTAFGAGGGGPGTAAAVSGGGGGGQTSAGTNGSAANSVGGGPGATGSGLVGAFGGGGSSTSQQGNAAGWGGASGAGSSTINGFFGGSSLRGGSGGGAGGVITAANAAVAGGNGGSAIGNNGGGGAGGAATGANGGAGTAGPTPLGPGTAGGGGGAHATLATGNGGAGGIACGGGGGAASLNGNNSGAGGAGGDGLIRVWFRP